MNTTITPRQAKAAARKAAQERIADAQRIAREVVASGKCPICGSPLHRNLAIAGWWQCVAYPCDSHRQPQYRSLPKCEFQCFTE